MWQKIKHFLSEKITLSNTFLFLGILLIFFIALRPPTDPDMGWHLKDGEYLLTHNMQVARSDIFSYTMPQFPLIMHEWITDAWMFFVYQRAGLFVLTLIFTFISTTAFVLVTFGARAKREYKIIAAILGAIASVPILGVRPQMLSLLGLALVVFLIFRFRENPQTKIVNFLPLIFFLWVNMHGGFSVGLFFVGIFLLLESVKIALQWLLKKFKEKSWNLFLSEWLKKNTLEFRHLIRLGALFVLSGLATLVNPYGWRVYIEVVNTIFDSYAKANIGEWMPVTIANPTSFQFFIYLTLLAILLLISYRHIDYTYLALSGVFLYLGFSSWRNMPIFIIISTPLWINIVESIAGSELLKMIKRKAFLLALMLAVGLIAHQQLQNVLSVSSSVENLSAQGGYPYKAVQYLKANPIEGKIFNEYNWGGFLIWQYPDHKLFVDGRMPSWKVGDYRVFEDFNKISGLDSGWEDMLGKYDIAYALIYNNPLNGMKFSSLKWKQVYQDDLAVIYERP